MKIPGLVHDLVVLVLRLEVWNLERPHGVERQDQCLVSLARALLVSQVPTDLSQGTENPRPIESLTLTVFAVIHHLGGLSGLVRLRTGVRCGKSSKIPTS
jgi:hypothetical protein